MDASAVNGIIKIAITGFGTIGPRHADAVLRNDDLKLVAVVDPVSGPASIAFKYGAKFYNSLEELLASPHKPDAAIICTLNHTHTAAANLLSSAGVHILIEKPLCPDRDWKGARRLLEGNQCLLRHQSLGGPSQVIQSICGSYSRDYSLGVSWEHHWGQRLVDSLEVDEIL